MTETTAGDRSTDASEIDEVRATRGAEHVRAAVAAVEAGSITKAEAVAAVLPSDVEYMLHHQFDAGGSAITSGLGASPGAAVGAAYFSPDAAVDAYDAGEDVILVMIETSPKDVHGMAIAEGILTSRGGLASHAAVVARGWGKPAVCGAEALRIGQTEFSVGSVTVRQGDVISIDGGSGEVFLGALSKGAAADDVIEAQADLVALLSWADEIRLGKLGVRANADTAADAQVAMAFGAEGIGLCRTEHQFLGERLGEIRRMILASTPEEEAAALAVLEDVQRADFVALLDAMDGLPVTVRLLDPPLHEFLPDLEELVVSHATGELDLLGQELMAVTRAWQETNPMLGTRGVRLGILRHGLYHMQVRALLHAAASRHAAGARPRIEIMVPLIVERREFELVRRWIDDEIRAVNSELAEPLDVLVGTMIETPRAAICAADIAEAADFFSFGTNDLTQLTFGFSRDDVESRIIREYLALDLLEANPFETLDVHGVGVLVLRAAEEGRRAKPGLKLGICGEHGGDPASIDFCYRAGLDYVSCSPYRVPIARLAAAQAVLRHPRP